MREIHSYNTLHFQALLRPWSNPDYFLIGRVSATTDEITDLVRQLPEDQQELIIKLLKVYLDAQNKSESK